MPRLRPQFSLLTALLVTTIVVLGLVVWRLGLEIGPMRAELRTLRDELGVLSIEDPAMLHAIQVRTDNPFGWKWRVWVPKGQQVRVHQQWQNVPRTGFPAGGAFTHLGPGKHWIELTAQYDSYKETWIVMSRASGVTVSRRVPGIGEWITGSPMSRSQGVGPSTLVAPDSEGPFLIKRHRTAQNNNMLDRDDPLPGFIVWLEPQK